MNKYASVVVCDEGPRQQVHSGYVTLKAPKLHEIDIKDIAQGLSRLPRFMGQTHLKLRPYSVAQHSVYAYLKAPEPFKLEALLHDAGEYLYGDVPSPLKLVLEELAPGLFFTIRSPIDTAIAEKFNLQVTAQVEHIIDEIDSRLLSTEKRDLMNDLGAWGKLQFPYGDMYITPWSASYARMRFMMAFNSEMEKRNADSGNR